MATTTYTPGSSATEPALCHGLIVELTSAAGNTEKAIIDRRAYRGPAFTYPGEDWVGYVQDLPDGTTVRSTGVVDPDYDHRATLKGDC